MFNVRLFAFFFFAVCIKTFLNTNYCLEKCCFCTDSTMQNSSNTENFQTSPHNGLFIVSRCFSCYSLVRFSFFPRFPKQFSVLLTDILLLNIHGLLSSGPHNTAVRGFHTGHVLWWGRFQFTLILFTLRDIYI